MGLIKVDIITVIQSVSGKIALYINEYSLEGPVQALLSFAYKYKTDSDVQFNNKTENIHRSWRWTGVWRANLFRPGEIKNSITVYRSCMKGFRTAVF